MSIFEQIVSELEIIHINEIKHYCDFNSLVNQFILDKEIILIPSILIGGIVDESITDNSMYKDKYIKYFTYDDTEFIQFNIIYDNIPYLIIFDHDKSNNSETYSQLLFNDDDTNNINDIIDINLQDLDEKCIFYNRKITNYLF